MGARVYNSIDLSTANNTAIALTFDTERYDTASIHSSNSSQLVAPRAGVYQIAGNVRWDGSTTGKRDLYIRLNGGDAIAYTILTPTVDNAMAQNVSTIYYLVAGDYVELYVYQNSGGALDVKVLAKLSPEFMMQRIGG